MKSITNGDGRLLGRPADWNEDIPCDGLQVEDYRVGESNVMKSKWLPTGTELDAILAGEPITLWVWGNAHPPVAVSVDNFDDYEEMAEQALVTMLNAKCTILEHFPEKSDKPWLFTEHMVTMGFRELGIGDSSLRSTYVCTPSIAYDLYKKAKDQGSEETRNRANAELQRLKGALQLGMDFEDVMDLINNAITNFNRIE